MEISWPRSKKNNFLNLLLNLTIPIYDKKKLKKNLAVSIIFTIFVLEKEINWYETHW